MIKNFLLVIVFFPIHFFSQLSSEKQKFIQYLSKVDFAESKNIGIGGELSEVYKSFEDIKGKLDDNDLEFLAKNSSNSLRFYSSIELLKRNNIIIIDIFKYYKKYPLFFKYQSGCVVSKANLTDLILNEISSLIESKEFYEEAFKSLTRQESDSNYVKVWISDYNQLIKILTPKFYEIFNAMKIIEKENSIIKK